jgi:isochorismate pyruvate lyase
MTERGIVGGIVFALAGGGLALAGAALAQGAASTDTPAYWGRPSVDGGKCCRTLGEVRENIDRVDKALVALMAERGQYVHEAARFKRDPAAVEDTARVEAIIRKVRGLAEGDHLNPDVAEATYRTMIAGFTEDERRVAAALMREKAQ